MSGSLSCMFKQIELSQKVDHPLATYQWALARGWFFHVYEISKNDSNEVRCDTTIWLYIDLAHEIQPFFRRLSRICSETKSRRYKFLRICSYLRNDRRIRIKNLRFPLFSSYVHKLDVVLTLEPSRWFFIRMRFPCFLSTRSSFLRFGEGQRESNSESFETTGISDNATQNIGKTKAIITST